MARTVVCISHATGAGGEEVGRLVAERLGFLYVDEELVASAAAKGGIEPAGVADEERRKALAARARAGRRRGGGRGSPASHRRGARERRGACVDSRDHRADGGPRKGRNRCARRL